METFEYIYILTDDEDFAEKETEETDDTEEN